MTPPWEFQPDFTNIFHLLAPFLKKNSHIIQFFLNDGLPKSGVNPVESPIKELSPSSPLLGMNIQLTGGLNTVNWLDWTRSTDLTEHGQLTWLNTLDIKESSSPE